MFSCYQDWHTVRLLAGRRGHALAYLAVAGWVFVVLFFSLAIVKRFAELQNLRLSGSPPRNTRGYVVADLDQLRSFGTSSAFAAVVVFAYLTSAARTWPCSIGGRNCCGS